VDLDRSDIRELLDRARQGEKAAFDQLFQQFHEPIRQTIALRLDRRLTSRIDPLDVLQDTYLEAARRLEAYLQQPSMPFELWLRWLAREQILVCHRRHLQAERRAATLEVGGLPLDSSAAFVRGLLGKEPSPSQVARAGELAELLRRSLARLDDDERDLILWRHFEHLRNREVAQLLGITEAAANKRYIRALERLRGFLHDLGVSGAE
jgi:RNA polymerase sigma-70 factor (ECF subfamily)